MNWATIIVLAIVVAIFAAIVISAIRGRKKGKSFCSCAGGCDHCGGCAAGKDCDSAQLGGKPIVIKRAACKDC